ncbi:MAG: hypothetical protein L6V84_01370 [Oscillospiraceae bacterium]|nr:MAG: hypothetical protein L6V84_01370 [Oscillospiraceae bacterium]
MRGTAHEKKNILLAMILASCGLFVACNGAGGQGSGETASKSMESTREQTEESVTASGTDGEPTAPATEEESSASETGGEAGPAAETIVYREYDFSAEIQEWTPEKLADNIKSDDPAYVMAFQDPTVTPVKNQQDRTATPPERAVLRVDDRISRMGRAGHVLHTVHLRMEGYLFGDGRGESPSVRGSQGHR